VTNSPSNFAANYHLSGMIPPAEACADSFGVAPLTVRFAPGNDGTPHRAKSCSFDYAPAPARITGIALSI